MDRTHGRSSYRRARVRLAASVSRIDSSETMKIFLFGIGLAASLLLAGCYSNTRPKGIGRAAPNFTVQDSARRVSLSQFRGQIVVLTFWASWCPPCIAETPSLVNMQRQLQPTGVVVLAISADEDEDAYHRFLKNYGINFVTVRDPSEGIQHLYGTSQIPETYIIDRDGVLRRKFVSSVDWNSPEVLQFLKSL
jgi:cytochrome c biogenesis protein CcmG, thiol:disulfide interchange protein DsbE